jgi:hypothetical protein
MDRRKILIVNLSKGLVGDTNMKLLGSMITTRIFLGAMSRADLDPQTLKKSPNFYFYVDEFQNFANETFAEILSEARKYNLNLIIAHQYVEQMEEEVRSAVFGNVGTTVSFRVGPFDAETLEVIFSPGFMKEDLVNLGFAQIYLSLMIDGVGSRPFSAVTLPPIEPPARAYKQEVIEASRTQFGNARAAIEDSIVNEYKISQEEIPEPKPKFNKNADTRTKRPAPRADAPAAPRVESPAPVPVAPSEPVAAPRPTPQQTRNDAPRPKQPPREERPREREQKPGAPATSSMTAQDLRSIIKTLAENSQNQKQKQAADTEQKLKGALSAVTEKKPEPRPVHPPQPRPIEPPRTEQKPVPPPAQASVKPQSPAPFEVPEEVLKNVFKDDLS